MKLLLLIGCSVATTLCFAQERKHLSVIPSHPLYRTTPILNKGYSNNPNQLALQMKKFLAETGLQQGTIFLPQDNMPCIVTADPYGAFMPNAWKPLPNRNTMPNPAKPPVIDPFRYQKKS